MFCGISLVCEDDFHVPMSLDAKTGIEFVMPFPFENVIRNRAPRRGIFDGRRLHGIQCDDSKWQNSH